MIPAYSTSMKLRPVPIAPASRGKDSFPCSGTSCRSWSLEPSPRAFAVEMTPYATLRGRVVNPEGTPAAGLEVELRSAQGGFAAFTATTGSDGSFVFDQLSLGSFLLYAKPKPEPAVRDSDRSRLELVPTYFPSVEERVQAEKILVRAGLDLSGYEIRLRAAPVYRVRRTVVDQSGKPEPHATVTLISTAEGMSGPNYDTGGLIVFGILRQETETGVTADEEGRFTFDSVRSGPWRLLANSRGMGGATTATLAEHDLADLQIRIAPLLTLTGTVEFNGQPPMEPGRNGGLMLTSPDLRRYIVVFNRPDGTLRVPNLMPGAYRIVPLPAGTYSAASVLLVRS
jgi:Carboxypeptidase regulatory-like domain